MGEARNINCRITGISWAISLYLAPIKAIIPAIIKTTKNRFIAGMILKIIVIGFITPIISKTINTGNDACRKQ